MTIMENFWFGDWFIMMQLCKKMHPEVFHDLVIDLRNRYANDSFRNQIQLSFI